MTATVVLRLRQLGARTGHDIELRYRCVELRHEGHTYNPWVDRTWCRCGRVIRDGDVAVPPTRLESEERWAQEGRLKSILEAEAQRAGREQVAAVPSVAGEQFVLELGVA